MHTPADLLSAFNELFLDVAPVAALCALAVSWIRRSGRYRKTERRLRERLTKYQQEEKARREEQNPM